MPSKKPAPLWAKILLVLLTVCACVGWALGHWYTNHTDVATIQGDWRFLSMQSDGVVAPPAVTGSMTYHFEDGVAKISENGSVQGAERYILDQWQSAKWIDLKKGDDVGRGIYRLDGDKLTICVNSSRNKGERPAEFAAPVNSGRLLIELERIKM